MSDENMLFITEDQLALDTAAEAVEIQTTKYLIFVSDELMFGLDANNVVEIITDHSITHLPMVPEYISGIINLRGQIIPILDIRLRMGKMPCDDCSIIVIDVEGTQAGILVDSVAKMVDVPQENILPMPSQNAQKLISGMCSLPEGGTMLVLDCALLLHG